MYSASIQKWGNSQGIRIPKTILESLGIRDNDQVEIIPDKEQIIIRKAVSKTHKTLEERLEAFYGKPIAEIVPEASAPYDWGKPMGEEVW